VPGLLSGAALWAQELLLKAVQWAPGRLPGAAPVLLKVLLGAPGRTVAAVPLVMRVEARRSLEERTGALAQLGWGA
jgi:hypothetical protein